VKLLLLDRNLMWTVRLKGAAEAFGATVAVLGEAPESVPEFDIAIVDLGVPAFVEAIPQLKASGGKVVGRSGHKETELREAGKAAGCDLIATNGALAKNLQATLSRVL